MKKENGVRAVELTAVAGAIGGLKLAGVMPSGLEGAAILAATCAAIEFANQRFHIPERVVKAIQNHEREQKNFRATSLTMPKENPDNTVKGLGNEGRKDLEPGM